MMVKKLIMIFVFFGLLSVSSNANSIAQLFHSNTKNGFEKILNMAKKGNIEAMYYAGLSYEIGNGTKLNYKKAFQWYKKAADYGYYPAQYNIAFMYEYGYGTKKNLIEAYKWFYILGNDRECHLVAQKMSKKQIEKAKMLALQWGKKHGFELHTNGKHCCNEL